MSLIEAIVLGIVQGFTEFLPISSTGHLRIVPAFMGWEDPGAAFTAVTQLGTMAAVVIYFRSDLARIGRTWFRSLRDPSLRRDLDARMGWYILLGTIPIGIFGLAFKDQIENGARDLYLIGVMLIALGLVLLAAEQVGKRTRKLEDLNARDGAVIGFAQAVALIPGSSRSGCTITAGLFLGLRPRGRGALLVPAVDPRGGPERAAGAGDHRVRRGRPHRASARWWWPPCWPSCPATRRSPGCCGSWSNHSTLVFVVYRVVLGVVVLVLTATGAIS